MNRNNLTDRRKDFKKGIDSEECRRRRDDDFVRIRKTKRNDLIEKKRYNNSNPEDNTPDQSIIDLDKLRDIYSSNPQDVLSGLVYVRKISLYSEKKYREMISKPMIVNKLVEYLTYVDYPDHQYEAAWCLTNLLASESEISQPIIKNTMVGNYMLVLMKECANTRVRDLAIWCLGNIAGEGKKYRNIIIGEGGFETLLDILSNGIKHENKDIDGIGTQVWALSNLLRYNNFPFQRIKQSIPVLQTVLNKFSNPGILSDSLWALYYLSSRRKNKDLMAFINANIINPDFMKFLDNDIMSTPALKLIGNLIAGSDITTQTVLDSGFLKHLPLQLISSDNSKIKEICWIISNILAGTDNQIKMIIDSNILLLVLKLASTSDCSIKRECVYIFSNLVSNGNCMNIDYIVDLGAIKTLCLMLPSTNCPKMIKIILTALYQILCSGKNTFNLEKYIDQIEEYGLSYIEELQNHRDKNIYDKAFLIIDKFFQGDDMYIDIDVNNTDKFSF
jgi:importin subunit alpha-2